MQVIDLYMHCRTDYLLPFSYPGGGGGGIIFLVNIGLDNSKQGTREQGSKGAREQGNEGAREQGNEGTRERGQGWAGEIPDVPKRMSGA